MIKEFCEVEIIHHILSALSVFIDITFICYSRTKYLNFSIVSKDLLAIFV
jgi:hypothetical protein